MSRHDDQESAKQLTSLAEFTALSGKDVKRVLATGTRVHQPANWSLMAEGTGADKAYIILSGTASVRHGGDEVATLHPGDVVGEIGVLAKKLRTASVVSTSPMEVLHFTREQLQQLVDEVPAFGQALRRTADERLD